MTGNHWFGLYFLAAVFCYSCQKDRVGRIAGIRIIDHPSQAGGQSQLVAGSHEKLLCSWLEYLDDTMVELRYTTLQDDQWTKSTTIGSGSNWFVNWADFPSLVDCTGFLAAHWLEYRGKGTYEYDVKIALSADGQEWNQALVPHRDSVKAEHGFVSLLPTMENELMVLWLDGRFTEIADQQSDDHHHEGGAMTLRTAVVSKEGKITDEYELDHRVCDCCQTDAAMTDQGPVVVYRNRTETEIRDVYLVRMVEGMWQEPYPVHNDHWKIGGCPVNGPAVSAVGKQVVVVWYTMADNIPQVKLSFSRDAGANFDSVMILSHHQPLGRVDVEFIDSKTVLATWVEETEGHTAIMARIVTTDLHSSPLFPLVETSSSRSSGFPQIARVNNRIYLSWTAVDRDYSKVKTAEIMFR